MNRPLEAARREPKLVPDVDSVAFAALAQIVDVVHPVVPCVAGGNNSRSSRQRTRSVSNRFTHAPKPAPGSWPTASLGNRSARRCAS